MPELPNQIGLTNTQNQYDAALRGPVPNPNQLISQMWPQFTPSQRELITAILTRRKVGTGNSQGSQQGGVTATGAGGPASNGPQLAPNGLKPIPKGQGGLPQQGLNPQGMAQETRSDFKTGLGYFATPYMGAQSAIQGATGASVGPGKQIDPTTLPLGAQMSPALADLLTRRGNPIQAPSAAIVPQSAGAVAANTKNWDATGTNGPMQQPILSVNTGALPEGGRGASYALPGTSLSTNPGTQYNSRELVDGEVVEHGMQRVQGPDTAPGVADKGRWEAFADGGILNEVVLGVGQTTGKRYIFGEAGKEWVVPRGKTLAEVKGMSGKDGAYAEGGEIGFKLPNSDPMGDHQFAQTGDELRRIRENLNLPADPNDTVTVLAKNPIPYIPSPHNEWGQILTREQAQSLIDDPALMDQFIAATAGRFARTAGQSGSDNKMGFADPAGTSHSTPLEMQTGGSATTPFTPQLGKTQSTPVQVGLGGLRGQPVAPQMGGQQTTPVMPQGAGMEKFADPETGKDIPGDMSNSGWVFTASPTDPFRANAKRNEVHVGSLQAALDRTIDVRKPTNNKKQWETGYKQLTPEEKKTAEYWLGTPEPDDAPAMYIFRGQADLKNPLRKEIPVVEDFRDTGRKLTVPLRDDGFPSYMPVISNENRFRQGDPETSRLPQIPVDSAHYKNAVEDPGSSSYILNNKGEGAFKPAEYAVLTKAQLDKIKRSTKPGTPPRMGPNLELGEIKWQPYTGELPDIASIRTQFGK